MNIEYKVIRSAKRKTIALQIKNCQVVVRAPLGVSRAYIENLVADKTQWILSKLSVQNNPVENLSPTYLPDSELLIKGETKTLLVSYQNKKTSQNVLVNENNIVITLSLKIKAQSDEQHYLSAHIKKHLAIWMKTDAEHYLTHRLNELSNQLNLKPLSYKVRRYKARWGSCNNKKELSFNYLLAMAPKWVFDYVIVHELCHIKYLNHSPQFWALVKYHMPHYKTASQWLKQNQAKMQW